MYYKSNHPMLQILNAMPKNLLSTGDQKTPYFLYSTYNQ